jgi:hypothetical protein
LATIGVDIARPGTGRNDRIRSHEINQETWQDYQGVGDVASDATGIEMVIRTDRAIWWTGMKVLKQDGSRHHGVGILPTIPASRTLEGVAARRDEVLEAGIEAARQLAARPARKR